MELRVDTMVQTDNKQVGEKVGRKVGIKVGISVVMLQFTQCTIELGT